MPGDSPRSFAGCILWAALAACDGGPQPEVEGPDFQAVTSVYRCDDGDASLDVITRTSKNGLDAWLPGAEHVEYIVLPRVAAASGSRYENDDAMVWAKGDEAMIRVAGREYRACVRDARASIWEGAKLDGVDFRGVGNEPGWVLEIRNREELTFTYDYGASSVSAVANDIRNDPSARQSVLTATVNGVPFVVTLSAKACGDSMSGESFESTVSITLGDRSFSGCGRPLH